MAAERQDKEIPAETAAAKAQGMTPRVVTARAVGIGALMGVFLGLPVAVLSTIRFTPPDGFDGWWTRLSEGFTIGGILGGLLACALGWRIELQCGFRTLKPCLADRRTRLVTLHWWLLVLTLVPLLASAIAWFAIVQGRP